MSLLKFTKGLSCIGILLLLLSCETGRINQSAETATGRTQEPIITEESVRRGRVADPFLRARILADMLYAASEAFDDNRLMLPAGDNAYDRYLEVLSFEPDNQVAQQGIEDIVDRYVEMANQAMALGQFDNAQSYLQRAASINPEKAGIADARTRLERERSISRDYFTLDPLALEQQSLEVMSQLGSIGQLVRNHDATFLITARTDAEARWIYRVMREAVGGYRLRGNTTIGPQPMIQVNIPQS